MNFDSKGSFDIQSNASNIASNFNPMNMGRLNLEQNLNEDNLDEYIEKLSLEDSRFQTEEDFQKFLDSGMSFPESYSFFDNFWGSKASNIEEVDFDFNYPFVEMNSFPLLIKSVNLPRICQINQSEFAANLTPIGVTVEINKILNLIIK